ncbi:MAG TPA: YeeE/YedE thiosulfate transporter family protein, partial [Candidatus Acidoferrum sp.]|nr:YeeE/YedE thiosulfate transporter family protein [Candidatus Acidoferrum sp.]
MDQLGDRRSEEGGSMVTSHLTAVDAALAAGDVPAALRAWHEAYGAAMGSRRWEGFADAGDVGHHLVGAVLMGVGGVTGMGCSIGQGISGLSTLSATSFVTVAAMLGGAVA